MNGDNIKNKIKHVISYFRWLVKKQEITELDLCQYLRKTIRNILYVNKQHLINRRRLIKIKNRVILKHNGMKYKSWPRKGVDKKRKQNIEDALNWSKRVVLYLKRQRALAKLQNKELHLKPILQSNEIRELNERIEEYKRNAQKNANIDVSNTDARNVTPEKNHNEISQNSISPTTLNCQTENKSPNEGVECSDKRVNFLDYLINKLKNDDVQQQYAAVPPKRTNNRMVNIIQKELQDDGDTSSSSDFMGFDDAEIASGLLATPRVTSQSDKSAFVSEKLNTFLRENSLENSTDDDLPTFHRFEDGLVCEGAPPPAVKIEKVPNNFGKARTVAEKRMLFGTKNRAKCFIIENGNTVYREFKKCTESGQCNKELIEKLQNMEVPLTRDTWTAASWLRTRNAKYYYQTVNIDGKDYKLSGSRGNHSSKILTIQNKTPILKHSKAECPDTCTQKSVIKGVRLRQTGMNLKDITNSSTVENASKLKQKRCTLLNSLKTDENCKPGPLSKKRLLDGEKRQIELAVYEMPSMQIEVYPKVNRPLDERVKPYLKLILPSARISREWAEFSVSTLVTKTSKPAPAFEKPFTFNIPYLNDQTTVLVRKLCKRNEKLDCATDLEFTKHVDRNNELEATCADVLTEMIDSVALGLSENSLIKNDPDIDYNQNKMKCNNEARNVINKEVTTEPPAGADNLRKAAGNSPKSQTRLRLLQELKRLNATIVQTDDIHSTATVKCNKDHCRLGCVCPSVLNMSTSTPHCSRIECMLRCTCDINEDLMHTNESALLLRERSTARLAKVEKEFCSTLVLTNDSTYLLNESHGEKRRSKRAPKRFDDYVNERDLHQANNDETYQEPSEQDNGNVSTINLKKHCNVIVDRLPLMENIEPWCMVHCLYKCFCKGNITEGDPFKIEVDNDTVEETEIVSLKKRQYSFAKEESKKPPTAGIKKSFTADIKKSSFGDLKKPSLADLKKPSLADIKRKYYSSGYVYGSRVARIPSVYYKNVNRARAKSIKFRVASDNTDGKLDLLNRRIAKSLTYLDGSSSNDAKSNEWIEKQQSIKEMPISNTPTQPQRTESEESAESNVSPPKQSPVEPTNSVPVISSVVSLNPNSKSTILQVHPMAMQFLNTAVTTSIKSIRNMLNQNSKRIFDPVQRTLHSMQWSYFLDAFVNGIIFVWEICINDKNILIATTKNVMPQIPGAMSAVNINISSSNDLPLLGKMLRSGVCGDKTKSLSVLLAGQTDYWLLIGFHNTHNNISQTGLNIFDTSTGLLKMKPTPQTHPEIREKINKLYKIFVLRQMRLVKLMQKEETPDKFVPISKASDSNVEYTEKSDLLIPLDTNSSGNESVLACDNSDEVSTADNVSDLVNVKEATYIRSSTTNIEIKQLPQALVGSIIIPVPTNRHHFWYMVVVGDDCSHIYVPKWEDFLTIQRIQDSTLIATRNHKSVMLGAVTKGAGIYVTPNSDKTFYVGPFFESPTLELLVCKMLNGKIILREDFAKNHNMEYTTKTIAYRLQLKQCTLILPKENQSGKSENRTNKAAEVSRKRQSTEPGRSILKKIFKSDPRQWSIGNSSTPSTEHGFKNHAKTNMLPATTTATSPISSFQNLSIQNSMPSCTTQKTKSAIPNKTPNHTVTSTSVAKNRITGTMKKSSLMDTQSPVRIPGFFITSSIKLGKIPAQKIGGIYEIQSPSSKRWIKFYTENQVHNFLMGKLSLQTRQAYSSQNLQWQFVAKFVCQDLEHYPLGDYHYMNNILPFINSSIKDESMETATSTSHEKNKSAPVINRGQLTATTSPPFVSKMPIPPPLGLQRRQTTISDVIVIDD